jgi:pimeloyl-ACP methyl ester carboxylesterase
MLLVLGIVLILGTLFAARWAIWQGFRVDRVIEVGSPGDYGEAFTEATIPAVGGKRLFGWLMSAGPGAPLIVVMHGWGANAESMLPLAVPIRRHGYSVLVIDARSHGRSDQDNFSSMPRFAEDIDSALDWAALLPDVDPHALAVLGHSVGGAAGLLAASGRENLRAVISLSAFDHPETVMRTYLSRAKVPYRPIGWMICRYVERIIGHTFDDIAPVATISRIRCPVLIGHGADDLMVAPAAASAIFARATSPMAELAILDGTGHDEAGCFERISLVLTDFLDRSFKAREAISGGMPAGP